MANDKIVIKGAREHNLKNVNLTLPREKFIVMTGLSGSGKSSLAFDTIYADGQRRYVESLSSYARMFLGRMDKPDVDEITGLSPALAAACGMAAVFCGVTNCPISSMFLSFELFGFESMPFVLLTVAISYLESGYFGLYHSQKILYSKTKLKFINTHTKE